jgi:hypothetical protein
MMPQHVMMPEIEVVVAVAQRRSNHARNRPCGWLGRLAICRSCLLAAVRVVMGGSNNIDPRYVRVQVQFRRGWLRWRAPAAVAQEWVEAPFVRLSYLPSPGPCVD